MTALTTASRKQAAQAQRYQRSVLDFGASGDGITNDKNALNDAAVAGSAMLPAGTYYLSENLNFEAGQSLKFLPGARIKLASGVKVEIQDGAVVEAPREHIFELADNTCRVFFYGGDKIKPEWFGLLPTNSAATNKANWDKAVISFSGGTTPACQWMDFASATYPFDAPFFLPPRLELRGQGMWSTFLDLEGTDTHGVETVTIENGAITREGSMSSSPTYAKLFDLSIDCAGISQSSGRFFGIYGAGWSSGVMERCRLNGPGFNGGYADLMDGVFLGPQYNTSGDDFAAIRNAIRQNRITNFRDGIVCGRYMGSTDPWEPAKGGDDLGEPGGCYESTIAENYVSGRGDQVATTPRYGIVINRDDNTTRRDRPYQITVANNTFDAGRAQEAYLTGTVSRTNGSATVTGSGTKFTEEINLDGTGAALFWGAGGGWNRIQSVDSDTQITLNTAASSTDSSSQVLVKKGVGIFVDTKGVNITAFGNYIDEWEISLFATSNTKNGFYFGNDGAGSPWSQGSDNGTDNFFHHVGSGNVNIRNTPT
jgi:hypothetical protein